MSWEEIEIKILLCRYRNKEPSFVHLTWIPGHRIIEGNEVVDLLAKAGLSNESIMNFPPSIRDYRQHVIRVLLSNNRVSHPWFLTNPHLTRKIFSTIENIGLKTALTPAYNYMIRKSSLPTVNVGSTEISTTSLKDAPVISTRYPCFF